MKKIISLLIAFLLIVNLSACVNAEIKPEVTNRVYECDYKTLNLNTEITTKIDGTDIIISGNVFRWFTDPLTVKDADENVLGYAGDAYGIIEQDDHGIYIGEEFEINMCGNFELFGNSYKLKDSEGNVVAIAEFNMSNTNGRIVDTNGELIATYSSSYFMNDYTVTIYDNNICSDMAILMIMASYVSDYKADE